MTNSRAVAAHPGRVSFGLPSLPTLAALTLIALAGTAFAPGAYAQEGAKDDAQATAKKDADGVVLADFVHYVRTANYEVANKKLEELLAQVADNQGMVNVIEAYGDMSKYNEALQRALQNSETQVAAGKVEKMYETGLLSRARDHEQITKNIADLTKNARSEMLARQRLVKAGEYAMPQLMEAFLDRSKPALHPKIQSVMRDLGRQAIIPLVVTMANVPPPEQERIANLLGLLQYRTSVPFLVDLAQSTKSESVKAACNRAVANLGGASADVGALYRELAEGYYNEKSELTSFPNEDFQLLWEYVPGGAGGGLTPTAIKTPVFHEAMTMRLAERAMTLEGVNGSPNPETIALWVASNFSREIDTPKNYENPAYPAGRRPAAYYAVASGADISQRVLARAIDARDTPLARHALTAVEKTAGSKNLASNGGRMPLLEALTYPSRRVQYEAALALAVAQPQAAFAGSDRVVPVLASSIRGATAQYAVVIVTDAEIYQGIRKTLTGMGYTVLPQGRSMADLRQPIAEAPAVDLVVASNLNADQAPVLVTEVRNSNKTGATPVLILTNPESSMTLRNRYSTDHAVAVRQVGIPADAMSKTITDLLTVSTGGPVTEQEAHDYSLRSLSALRDLAVSGNTVLNVGDASLPLIAALNDPASADRALIGEVLSRVNQDACQRAVMEAALAAKGAERVAMLGLVADSAKRFGNMLDVRQVAQVMELATKGPDDEATAAAGLMGALSLSNADVVEFIKSKK